jgi:MoxR-like ATPase
LITGEPGVGKTQIAEAAAVALGRCLLTTVVDSRTEARDLLYSVDTVRRLAEAQLCGAFPSLYLPAVSPNPAVHDADGAAAAAIAGSGANSVERRTLENRLRFARRQIALKRFVAPGPLWWAFDWESAMKQSRLSQTAVPHSREHWQKAQGQAVLLIDEIDKAETDVPNGLLEALGERKFRPVGRPKDVVQSHQTPLVVITTNGERALPDPFLRRCFVLHLELPGKFDEQGRNTELENWLVERGKRHFLVGTVKPKTSRETSETTEKVLREAAAKLVADRWDAIDRQRSLKPGQAEYLDLVRAVVESGPGAENEKRQLEQLDEFREFVFSKQREAT